MNNIILKEKQNFMGIQIPVIEGGFGKGQKVMLAKTIAEIHDIELRRVNELINNNLDEFEKNIDILDLKTIGNNDRCELRELGFTNRDISISKNIYLLSEQGYMALVGLMRTDKAKEIRKKLRREYFAMRADRKEIGLDISELSPELQMFNNILQTLAKNELEQKEIKKAALEAKEEATKSREEVQAIREVVAINSSDWKNDCKKLITKIAYELGGIGHINDVYREVYSILDKRMKTKLNVRLTNKRRRMADEGVCKSKRDKLNYINVIEDDCKLIEGYVAIVKELAIKYGVA